MTLEEKYQEYLKQVESENFDRNMYDGDTYTPEIEVLDFEEWLEVNNLKV